MDMVFIGHQGWFISHGGTNVLIDPLLMPTFGHSESVAFRVYPFRKLDLEAMPRIDAVFLSHEHLDHFHLPSLNRLPKGTPVIVGELMPACVVEAIEKLGREVKRVALFQTMRVGALEFTIYPGGDETIFWEKRVTQFLVREAGSEQPGIFVAVDALVSEPYKAAVISGSIRPPRAIVCSNNSQVAPPKAFNSRSNLLPIPNPRESGLAGLRILHSVLVGYLEGMPHVPDLVICGNGFVGGADKFVHLFSDHRRLAAIASELSVDTRVFGPYPGDRLNFDAEVTTQDRVDWIQIDEERMAELAARQEAHLKNPEPAPLEPLGGEFASEKEAEAAMKLVQDELPSLARAIMVAPLGVAALRVHQHLAGPCGSRRVLLRLRGCPNAQTLHYALDLNRAAFVPDQTPTSEILKVFPFGLEVYLIDLAAILQGKLQIWDLAGSALRSWFMGGLYENWMSFLFGHYGEQVRPDLAAKVYARAIDRIRGEAVGG